MKYNIFFDGDGTLYGNNGDEWNGWFKNNIGCIRNSIYKPHPNIIWNLLTFRPDFDKWILNIILFTHGLKPEIIITYPHKIKNDFNLKIEWKKSVLSEYENPIYVDNNMEVLKNIGISIKNIKLCTTYSFDKFTKENNLC